MGTSNQDTVKGKPIRGSATVEASVTLPVFLMAVMAIVTLMQYPLTCRQVGGAMSDVARMLSAGGYLAYLSGLQAVGTDIDRIASDGFVIEGEKLDEVADALASLAASPSDVPDDGDGFTGISPYPDNGLSGIAEAYRDLSRVLTAGGGQWVGRAYDSALNELVLALSTERLSRATSMSLRDNDPWRQLGIRNGAEGVDLSNSHYFSADGTIELVAVYTIKPLSLFGAAPAIKCCSRIRVIAWGAGVGPALRQPLAKGSDETAGNETKTSLWNLGNDASQLWQRGKAIEEAELDKLEVRILGNGSVLFRASALQSGFDALSAGMDINRATGFQIVSVNPFLAAYRDNPSAVKDLIRKQASRMPKMGDRVPAGKNSLSMCIGAGCLMLIVPENAPAWLETAMNEEKADMARLGISLELIRGYGTYDGPGTESTATR